MIHQKRFEVKKQTAGTYMYYDSASEQELKDLIFSKSTVHLRDYLAFTGPYRVMLYQLSDGRIVETNYNAGFVFHSLEDYCYFLYDGDRIKRIRDTAPKNKRRLHKTEVLREIEGYHIPPQFGDLQKIASELLFEDSESRRFTVYLTLLDEVLFYDHLSDTYVLFPSREEWEKVDLERDYSRLFEAWDHRYMR